MDADPQRPGFLQRRPLSDFIFIQAPHLPGDGRQTRPQGVSGENDAGLGVSQNQRNAIRRQRGIQRRIDPTGL